MDILAGVRVELSLLRTVRPGIKFTKVLQAVFKARLLDYLLNELMNYHKNTTQLRKEKQFLS